MKKYGTLYKDFKTFREEIQKQEIKLDCRYFVCIHTAKHAREEAVQVAREIKKQLPLAEIIGTSADYVIYNGDIVKDECLVLLYEFEKSDFYMGKICYDGLSPKELAMQLENRTEHLPIKAMFAFFSDSYNEVQFFLDEYNQEHSDIHMIGGVAGTTAMRNESPYIFNEEGVWNHSLLFCSIYGEEFTCYSDILTGHEALGEVCTVTGTEDEYVDEVNGEPFVHWLKEQLGVKEFVENAYHEEMAEADILLKFPMVMQNYGRTSRFVQYEKASGRMMLYNTKIREGETFRIGYLSPLTTANECRELCERMGEQPAEVIVSYSCIFRKTSLNNCSYWEMLPFRNCNICGAFMHGEIGHFDGKNEYLNGSNSLFTMAESRKILPIDLSAFDKMYRIEDDRKDLYNYVLKKQSETMFKKNAMLLQQIVEQEKEAKKNVFEDKTTGIPNMTKYSYDNKFRKYNKMCMITLSKGQMMQAHFGEAVLNPILKDVIQKIRKFVHDERVRIYRHNEYSFVLVANDNYDLADFLKLSEQLYEKYNQIIVPELDFTCINIFVVVFQEKHLIEKARYATYEAERSNHRYVVYDKNKKLQEAQSLNDTLHMVTIISEAIRKDRVEPFFQPIYDNRTKKFSHAESLMRIKDKDGTIYYPNQFMDIAKDYRLYLELSKVMIMKVFDLFEYRHERVSMNISAYDIQEEATRQAIYERLEEMSPKCRSHFIFEVLESENYEDQQVLMQFIHKVRSYGVKIAVDDFGSGYSNLLEIASLDPDYLKIDGELIRDFVNDKRKQIIVDTIVFMAGKLNLNVVAERVENKEIQDEIVKKGIAYTQGYYFSKPMKFSDFVEFQEKNQKIG